MSGIVEATVMGAQLSEAAGQRRATSGCTRYGFAVRMLAFQRCGVLASNVRLHSKSPAESRASVKGVRLYLDLEGSVPRPAGWRQWGWPDPD